MATWAALCRKVVVVVGAGHWTKTNLFDYKKKSGTHSKILKSTRFEDLSTSKLFALFFFSVAADAICSCKRNTSESTDCYSAKAACERKGKLVFSISYPLS